MFYDLKTIKVLACAFPFFVGLDALWIGYFMNSYYKEKIGSILRMSNGAISPELISSLIVWALIVLGSYIFVLPRIIEEPLIIKFLWGGLYGLILYGVYDLTNYAILSSWPLSITLVDLGWGIFANGLLAVFLSFLSDWFGMKFNS
jgi:uncharacterized membrane protein